MTLSSSSRQENELLQVDVDAPPVSPTTATRTVLETWRDAVAAEWLGLETLGLEDGKGVKGAKGKGSKGGKGGKGGKGSKGGRGAAAATVSPFMVDALEGRNAAQREQLVSAEAKKLADKYAKVAPAKKKKAEEDEFEFDDDDDDDEPPPAARRGSGRARKAVSYAEEDEDEDEEPEDDDSDF